MPDRTVVIENLRNAARNGSGVCNLIDTIRSEVGAGNFNSFAAMSYLIEAFGLSLSDVRELPGARCLGGGAYSDEEIEKMLYPSIKKALTHSR